MIAPMNAGRREHDERRPDADASADEGDDADDQPASGGTSRLRVHRTKPAIIGRLDTRRRPTLYSSPMRFGGQYVANALPMIQSRGTGPQKRLSSDEPRLSPIMK
jgi:hypothetical protein